MTLKTCFFATTLSLMVFAQAPRFQRRITPSASGPQRLDVDLTVLGGAASGLADLRIRTAGGQDVPYVRVPPRALEGAWKTARLFALTETKTNSGFEMDLGSASEVGRLRVEGLRAPFLKRFRLEGSGDRQHWTELIAEGSLFDLPSEGLRQLDMDFQSGSFRFLRLTWDDRSSARMGLPARASAQELGGGDALHLETVPFERRISEPGTSRFVVHLPGAKIPVRALRLQIGGQGPLLREARVSEGRLRESGLVPVKLGQASLRRTERDGASASELRIPLDGPEGSDLDLKVEDGNNAPLDLKGVQVELEAQPWIYFEAPSGESLIASYGDPRQTAPRYDLEALRETLIARHSKLAQARWGAVEGATAATHRTDLQPMAGLGPGASLDAKGFGFQRPILDGAPGLTALVLDSHVLAHSRNLRDLRILDENQRQIPYLLEQREEALSLELSLGKGVSEGRTTRYRLELPQEGLPDGKLVLSTEARIFQRAVTLREEREGASEVIQQTTWIHGDAGMAAPSLVLGLPSRTRGKALVLEIDEGDNPPLSLKAAHLQLPTWRLRFFHPGKGLRLCYGRELDCPSYDLALLADQLRNAPAREIALQSLDKASAGEGAPLFTRLFWGVLILALVALLFMLARLLKQPPADGGNS